MEVLHTILTVIQVLMAIALVVIVSMQSGKGEGLSGAITGGGDSFMARNKGKALDAKLAKATKWLGGVFIVLTFALNLF